MENQSQVHEVKHWLVYWIAKDSEAVLNCYVTSHFDLFLPKNIATLKHIPDQLSLLTLSLFRLVLNPHGQFFSLPHNALHDLLYFYNFVKDRRLATNSKRKA